MTIAACSDPARIIVTKSVVGGPFSGSAPQKEITLSDGDDVTFAIAIKNVGGATETVDITDEFDEAFDAVTWTRTAPNGSTTTGSGNISSTGVSIPAGGQVTYLVEATFTPAACTPHVINVASARIASLAQGACCDSNVVYDWAKVVNAAGPRAKVDATKGWTAMEALLYLLEGVDLPAKVKLDKFINSCGTLADFIGNGGDGVAVEILDAFGDGTGLYAETSAGS